MSSFLQDRMAGLKSNLEQSERALQAYREQKGLVSLGGSSQALTGRQLDGAMARLQEAKSKRLELESAYQQARATPPKDYADMPVVKRDLAVADTLKRISEAERALLVLQETYNDGHYRTQQAKSELVQLRSLLNQQSEKVVAGLRREYEGARSTEQLMEESLGAATGSVQAANRGEFQLSVLERDAASNRQLYELFMSRAKETNLTGDVQAPVARVIDRAVPKYTPVRPDKRQIVLRAMLLGAGAGNAGFDPGRQARQHRQRQRRRRGAFPPAGIDRPAVGGRHRSRTHVPFVHRRQPFPLCRRHPDRPHRGIAVQPRCTAQDPADHVDPAGRRQDDGGGEPGDGACADEAHAVDRRRHAACAGRHGAGSGVRPQGVDQSRRQRRGAGPVHGGR